MKTTIMIAGVCLLLLVVGASFSVQAKIYVWEDAEGRVHYASDPEEVPQGILDDEKQYRVIETTIVPSAGNAGTPPGSSAAPVRTAVTPPPVPTATDPAKSAAAGNELQTLQTEYRDLLKNMREFRKKNKNLNNSEYKQMQQKILDLRRRMAEARKTLQKK